MNDYTKEKLVLSLAGPIGLLGAAALDTKNAVDAANQYKEAHPTVLQRITDTAKTAINNAKKASEAYDNIYGDMTVHVKDSSGNSQMVNASEMKSAVVQAQKDGTNKVYYDSETKTFSPTIKSGITFDEKTGNITVKIPDSLKDDEYIKSYTNNDFLKKLSSNYKANNDVKYQDPYDENIQYTTKDYVSKLNEAISDRTNAINFLPTAKKRLNALVGSSENKDKLIKALDTGQLVIMSANGKNGSKYVAIPEWLSRAYPDVEKLASYSNGFALADDLIENFLVAKNDLDLSEGNKVASTYESWRATSLAYLNDDEMLYSGTGAEQLNEFAKNVAFNQFILNTTPDVGDLKGTMIQMDAATKGWWYGLLNGVESTLDNICAIVSGGTAGSVQDFFNWDVNKANLSDQQPDKTPIQTYMEITGVDPESVAKAKAESKMLTGSTWGVDFGVGLGSVLETAAEMSLMSALTSAITDKITTAALSKGATSTAEVMADEVAGTNLSRSLEIATEAETIAFDQASAANLASSTAKMANLTRKTQNFLNLTLNEAGKIFTEFYNGTSAVLNNISAGQAAKILNTATKSAKLASGLNSALGVMSDVITFAAVSDKKTLNKILTNKATDDETKAYLQQVVFATYEAKILGLGTNAFLETKAGQAVSEAAQKVTDAVSKKASKFTSKISSPWLKFREWFLKRKMENAVVNNKTVSNATRQAYEAVKESELRNIAREYVSTLSNEPVSNSGAAATMIGGANGVIINPITGETTPYQEGKAAMTALENSFTNRNDIATIYSELAFQIADPNIEPVMSAQNKEVNDTNSKILQLETSAGMIDKPTVKANKQWKKEPYSYVYSTHSKEVSDYAFLAYKVQHEMDVCIADNIPFEDSVALTDAKNELAQAGEKVPQEIQSLVNNDLLPSLQKLTKSLMDRMIYDWKVYPKEMVEGLRKEGRWGKDGSHYIRLVPREEPKTGVYESFDNTVKRINNIDLTRAGHLNVDNSTWIGFGPYELIKEAALAKTAKGFRNAAVKSTGLTPEIVMSGEQTAGARKMKEYRAALNTAIDRGVDSFAKDIEGTVAIGPKKIAAAEEYVKEVEKSSGVNSMPIDELRALMKEKGQLTTESIVDQNSLDALYINSSPDGQKLITDTLGQNITPFEITGGTIPNNSFFSTVAPYKFNPVDSSNYYERLGEINNTFNSVASKIADDIGIKVSNVRNNVGGYIFNNGDHVNEISFTYNFPKGTSREDAELFGCLLGDLGYEPQEAVIVGRYLNKASKANGYIIEYSIDTDAAPSIIDAIEKAGIESYTVDMVNGRIQVLAFPDDVTKMVSDKDRDQIIRQLKKINSIMKGKAHAIQRKAVDSRLIEKSDRSSLYRKWLDSHGQQRGGRLYNDVERALKAVTKAEKTGKAVADKNFLNSLGNSQYANLVGLKDGMPDAYNSFLNKLDRVNALGNPEVVNSPQVAEKGKGFIENSKLMENDTIFKEKFSYVSKTKEGEKGEIKYELDEDILSQDIDDAIDGMFEYIKEAHHKGDLGVQGVAQYQGVEMTENFFEYRVLNELLNQKSASLFKGTIDKVAKRVVDNLIPNTQTIQKGEIKRLEERIKGIIKDKFESRLAKNKAVLESSGYVVDSATITEIIDSYNTEIVGFKGDSSIIKTTDSNGEIQYEKVSPIIAELYNSRPVYKPLSTPMEILANAALMKRISLTNLSPRSFSKQAISDPLMAYITVGVLPGTNSLLDADMRALFGDNFANELAANDPFRYDNILAIVERDGISFADAALKELKARTNIQLPFTTMSREALTQANIGKYDQAEMAKRRRRLLNQKINSGLRKVSDKLGRPNDLREEYVRKLAGEKAYINARKKGYTVAQAEEFRKYAIDNATTNFRQKHTMFNNLRISTPYLTSGISGAKSFWKMFEMDPLGVTARILNGLILPIVYFMGEIQSDDDTRKKYADISQSAKDNHIAITVNGEIILVPVGEELGTIVNPFNHTIEELYGASKYDFWKVMLNDAVGLLPVDLTGFTDPEMWSDIVKGTPSFLDVMENGISKILAQTMPPVAQSAVMAATGRDLYTGNKVDTGYIDIDEDGNAYIQSYSQSQFSKAMANIIGGDARVIEKVSSGLFGTTAINVLDTIVSAVQYVSSGGQTGSLTTAGGKFISDITKPFATNDYASMDKQWQYKVSDLYDLKESIENSEVYKKYNEEISKESDQERRAKLESKRNDLLVEYQDRVGKLVSWYRDSGGSLDKKKFTTAVSLLTFEDAVRADRAFMELNTNYGNAYKQAMGTLNKMGVTNPDGVSMLGYIYTDENGHNQVKMWTPAQVQVIYDAYDAQEDIHKSRIEAIINSGAEDSVKNLRKKESEAEQPYWDKYNSTGKLSDDEWDKIDKLRKEFNMQVVEAISDYVDAYGAEYVLSSDAVQDYLNDVIKVPSSYEKVKNRFISSDNGKLNKQSGFAESYIKTIFGVK